MLQRGLKQSSRIVIRDEGSANNHIHRIVYLRNLNHQIIDEIWKLMDDNSIQLVYKNESPYF